jgi:hypothetical protein
VFRNYRLNWIPDNRVQALCAHWKAICKIPNIVAFLPSHGHVIDKGEIGTKLATMYIA